MAPKRRGAQQPTPKPPGKRKRKRKVLKEETRHQIESRVFEASPQLLDLLLRQRAWSYELWPEEAKEGEGEGETEEEERLAEPQEGEGLDDPDYEGRGADEDDDRSETYPERHDGEGGGAEAVLEALEAFSLERARRRPNAIDLEFQRLPNGEIVFTCPLGIRWLRLSAQDPIGSRYKEALRERIRTLSVVAELLLERNAEHLRGDAPQPSPLSQAEAKTRLQQRLGISEEDAKTRISRLKKGAWVRLPNGYVRPLEDFFEFERPKGVEVASALFFSLAAHYDEEKEKPYSDRELSELLAPLISTKRSNIQKVRSEWLPSSGKRAEWYREGEGKELIGLLQARWEEIKDDSDAHKKHQRLLAILQRARKEAERRSQDPRARKAHKRLTEWLQAVRSWTGSQGSTQQS